MNNKQFCLMLVVDMPVPAQVLAADLFRQRNAMNMQPEHCLFQTWIKSLHNKALRIFIMHLSKHHSTSTLALCTYNTIVAAGWLLLQFSECANIYVCFLP